MSSKERDVQTSLRVPQGLIDRIDKYMELDPQFNTRTDLILTAVRFYLDYRIQTKAREDQLESGLVGIEIENGNGAASGSKRKLRQRALARKGRQVRFQKIREETIVPVRTELFTNRSDQTRKTDETRMTAAAIGSPGLTRLRTAAPYPRIFPIVSSLRADAGAGRRPRRGRTCKRAVRERSDFRSVPSTPRCASFPHPLLRRCFPFHFSRT